MYRDRLYQVQGKKALLVTDSVMVGLGNCAKVETALKNQGIEYVIFSGVTGEPTDTMIEAGLKMYKDENCDFLVALGGGSPIDSMKAIGMMAAGGGNISDYMGKLQVPVPRLPNLRLSRIRREILKCF